MLTYVSQRAPVQHAPLDSKPGWVSRSVWQAEVSSPRNVIVIKLPKFSQVRQKYTMSLVLENNSKQLSEEGKEGERRWNQGKEKQNVCTDLTSKQESLLISKWFFFCGVCYWDFWFTWIYFVIKACISSILWCIVKLLYAHRFIQHNLGYQTICAAVVSLEWINSDGTMKSRERNKNESHMLLVTQQ